MFLRKITFILLTLFLSNLVVNAKEPMHHKHFLKSYIESTAKSKLGKKYVWGGNGPYNYDCSGFTKAVFALNGIKIPRNSWKQAQVGVKIKSRKNLKKGDLIFFNSKHHKGVNHVGIYLGHGKFIHASRFHKRIVISPLREYRRYFKWGRRLT
jgi:cell wall-associated NlpC family hydrolase